MFVGQRPQLLFSEAMGPLQFILQNRDGARSLFLHSEAEILLDSLEIPANTSIGPMWWDGGRLWISADDTAIPPIEYRILRSNQGKKITELAERQRGAA